MMPAMTETYSPAVRPGYGNDIHSRLGARDTLSTPPSTSTDHSRRSILPTDYHDLSPLDALAAQGRLLNRRLTRHGGKEFEASSETPAGGLDKSAFPKFGSEESLDENVDVYAGYDRMKRGNGIRKGGLGAADDMDGSRSPVDSLSMATMSLLAIPRPMSPNDPLGLLRSNSQASSVLSFSTSSDGSSTPTEDYLPPISYEPPPPPKQAPPKSALRLRPIIKTQHLARPQSPKPSPTTPQDQIFQIDPPSASDTRSYSPQLANTLDRPRLPSPQLNRPTRGTRTPSINFSRPYSSRSSMYSETSSAYEVDYFSGHKPSNSTLSIDSQKSHLSIPLKSPADSTASSPGLGDDEIASLPRGRSPKKKDRPLETGVFFHSKSMKSLNGAHRWPVTPPSTQTKFFPPATPESMPSERPARPSTSDGSPRLLPAQIPQNRSVSAAQSSPASRSRSHEGRLAPLSRSRSQENRRLQVPDTEKVFNSPTQILNPKTANMTLVPVPSDATSAEDHVNLGIQFHEQDLLPQSTHHFSLAAEMGSATGMLLYSLSLRHGWGCAANPAKAVEWLHSAAENASAEADANGLPRQGGGVFLTPDGKRGGATLALAIYELGQSYMHGWGVAKDKHLALRCYEISANFGDTDGQWYIPLPPFIPCPPPFPLDRSDPCILGCY